MKYLRRFGQSHPSSVLETYIYVAETLLKYSPTEITAADHAFDDQISHISPNHGK